MRSSRPEVFCKKDSFFFKVGLSPAKIFFIASLIAFQKCFLFHLKRVIWKSWYLHLGISIGIDVRIGIGIAKNFLSCKVFIFVFRSMKNTSTVKSFSRTLEQLPGSFSRCLEQLFCRKPLAPASEERNSTADVISGVLKTLTPESYILQARKFLIRNPIRVHFLEIFCKF